MFLNLFFSIITLFPTFPAPQVDPILMRINGRVISRAEFEYKLNEDKRENLRGKALKAYINQYIINQLKVSAAEAAGLDTLPTLRNALTSYKKRLVCSYLSGEKTDEERALDLYNKLRTQNGKGEVLIVQIFKPLLQTAKAVEIESTKAQMDSIYSTLKKKPQLFEQYVNRYSADKDSTWIGSLDCPEEMEEHIFSLPTQQISRPFFSPSGVHIVKIIGRRNIAPFDQLKAELIQRIRQNDNQYKEINQLVDRLKKELKYTAFNNGFEELLKKGTTKSILFTIGNKSYTGMDFERFANIHPMERNAQIEAFITRSVLEEGSEQLISKYPEIAMQINLYRDKLLTDEEDKVTSTLTPDSVALHDFFEKNRSEYRWEKPHFNGAVLYCTSKKIGKKARKLLKKYPKEDWTHLLTPFNEGKEQVKMATGVFAQGDNPTIDALVFKSSKYTPRSGFPYTTVVGKKQKKPTTYHEVMPQLLTDYQKYMKQSWIEHLRATSKVEISEEVLKTVNNH